MRRRALPGLAGSPLTLAVIPKPDLRSPEALPRWKALLTGSHECLADAIHTNDSIRGKNWSLAAAICQDKVNILEGKPTILVANLHAHRIHIPDLLSTMLKLAERMNLVGRLQALEEESIQGLSTPSLPAPLSEPQETAHAYVEEYLRTPLPLLPSVPSVPSTAVPAVTAVTALTDVPAREGSHAHEG